jgi:RNA polymerase sigma-70 factor, ECF subfamily
VSSYGFCSAITPQGLVKLSELLAILGKFNDDAHPHDISRQSRHFVMHQNECLTRTEGLKMNERVDATRFEAPNLSEDYSNKRSSQCSAVSELDDIDALVRKYRPYILRYALSALKDRDLAETVTQDCFLRAFNSRSLYRGECSVRTWLTAIAINLIRGSVRSRRFKFWQRVNSSAIDVKAVENKFEAHQQSAEGTVLTRELLGRVWSIVSSLSERQKHIFYLRFARDMELSEIAVATGLKVSAIKTHLHRALRTVRVRIGTVHLQLPAHV